MLIPIRKCTKKETSGPVIPDCVFRTAKSANVDVQKEGSASLKITLLPSPVIGDLLLDANYEFAYYQFTASQYPKARPGAKISDIIDNRDWPNVPRRVLSVIHTSAPEGEVITTGETVFKVPFGETIWTFFQLVNLANPNEQHWSELSVID